jgi:F-type H+-transporting ATPase subunit delta
MLASKISESYAKALLSLAISTNKIELITNDINEILNILKNNPQLKKSLINPTLKKDIKKKIIKSILILLQPIEKITENFLMVLLDRSRIEIFESIAEKFLILSYETQEIKIVNITAGLRIENKEQNEIINALKSICNAKEIKLIITIDEAIFSGIIVKIGSKVMDFSLKSRLKKLAKQLEITNF